LLQRIANNLRFGRSFFSREAIDLLFKFLWKAYGQHRSFSVIQSVLRTQSHVNNYKKPLPIKELYRAMNRR